MKVTYPEGLSPEAVKYLDLWLLDSRFEKFRKDTEKLLASNDVPQIEDSFYKHIEIGTGGIRGTLGVGPNRINARTIGEAAQGLANFIEDFGQVAKEKGVVVGYEARRQSREFAELCCRVFAANGIKSYIFDGLRATPETSFAVRYLKATAGVQLTASHNPRTDNGFKFYWSDGGQVVPPVDQKFMELVAGVQEIKELDFEKAKKTGLVEEVGEDIDNAYVGAICELSLVAEKGAKIVFSPIHGAGITNVLPVLKKQGFDVELVPQQAKPDENFPTAVGDLINPEYKEVMELPMKYGEEKGADIVINSDPDADRIGVASKVKIEGNTLKFLTGNEVGAAMCHFILERLKEKKLLKPEHLIIETYVTTSLISDIAKSFEVRIIDDLLVGFKFIGEIIEKLDNKGDFIFAAEESLGYLRGTFVRDKDAAIAALILGELTSYLKVKKKTLIGYLEDIYREFGYYKNILNMQEMRGKVGFENTGKIMKGLRNHPPTKLGGYQVLKVIDRLPEEERTEAKYKTGMTGDQLTFVLSEDGKTRVTVRPSGTEPKIKYYIQVFSTPDVEMGTLKKKIDEKASKLEESILLAARKYIQG